MTECNDYLNLAQQNKKLLSGGSTVNSKGEFTLNQLDVFAEELYQSIQNDQQTNPIKVAEIKYGEAFYSTVDTINSSILQSDLLKNRIDDYPSLKNRIERGAITYYEFSDFMSQYNHTPSTAIQKANQNYFSFIFELDSYYGNGIRQGSLGGICALFENVFASIDGFFDILGQIDGLIMDALSFVGKVYDLKNFVANQSEQLAVKTLIEQMKDYIEEQINNVFEVYEEMIKNFSPSAIMGDIETFLYGSVPVKVLKEKERMCLVFEPKSKATFLRKVRAIFDYAFSLFANPGLAEIQFLITRICGLIANVSALMEDLKSPLSQFEFKYKRIANRLKVISNMRTSTAIRSGAIRLSAQARAEKINRMKDIWSDLTAKTPEGIPPSNEKEITVEDMERISLCSLLSGNMKEIILDQTWVDDLGYEGWVELDYGLRARLFRLYDELQSPITVVHGWRSEQYNKKINGPPESPYMSGMAVGIKIDAVPLTKIVDVAIKKNFKYAEAFEDYVYLDTRRIL